MSDVRVPQIYRARCKHAVLEAKPYQVYDTDNEGFVDKYFAENEDSVDNEGVAENVKIPLIMKIC